MIERINKMIELCREDELLASKIAELEALRTKLENQSLILSVIGQFKRGKTSLVNCLLGENLLPVSIVPLTGVITEIRKGSGFEAEVVFKDGRAESVSADRLEEYISEQKNKENRKNVDAVKIKTKGFPFRENLTLVDTPGVGSLHKNNTDLSYDFVTKSDAVIFTLSVDSPVSETERDFLLRAGESAAEFFFAVNKTDTVSKESLSEYLAYCRSVLSEIMEKPVQLFSVSAKTREGVEELKKAVLSALEASQDRILEQSAEMKFLFLKRQIRSLLLLRRKTSLLSREELREKTEYVKAGIEKVHALSDEAQVLAKRDAKQLIEKIANSFQPELQNIYEREKRFLAAQKEELTGVSLKEFENQLSSRGEVYAKELLEALNQKGLDLLNEGYAQICERLESRSCSIAEDLSNLLKESFGVEYESARKEFAVSEKSDFHIAFIKSTAYLFDLNDFARFLPKKKAMEVISRKISDALLDKIAHNANNMIYNYRYKMQESLRELCSAYGKYTREMEEEFERILELAEGDSLSAEKGCEETVCRCDRLIRLTNEI